MNQKKLVVKLIVVLFLIVNISACSTSEDNNIIEKEKIPLFSETHFSKIHGDSEKSWRITEVINDYYDPNYNLEIELSCLADDVYTFYNTQNKFTVDLGEDKCFGKNDDGIFSADEEIFEGELMFMDASQGNTIYLRYSRGFINKNGSAQGVSIRFYTLAELSDTRMVFHREGAEFVGEYKQALIFEAI